MAEKKNNEASNGDDNGRAMAELLGIDYRALRGIIILVGLLGYGAANFVESWKQGIEDAKSPADSHHYEVLGARIEEIGQRLSILETDSRYHQANFRDAEKGYTQHIQESQRRHASCESRSKRNAVAIESIQQHLTNNKHSGG